MRPLPRSPIFLAVGVCLLVPALLPAQTGAKNQKADEVKAEALFVEALALHKEAKYEEALAKVKEALALAPTNTRLESYRADLQELSGKDDLERHALAAPPEAEASIEALARYLTKDAKDDRAKARAIYRWVTDRIAYDAAGFFAGQPGDNSAANVLKTRVAVCAGYAKLYEALGQRVGLEVVTVTGACKGYSFKPGEKPRSNHAWNAVKLDGKWQLLDSTWGAGSLQGKAFRKGYQPELFLAPPDEFIFTHFPDDARWQLLPTAVPVEEFARWPRLSEAVFERGLSAAAVRATVGEGRELVEMFGVTGPHVKLIEAPVERTLRAGEKYPFCVGAPGYLAVAAIVNGKFQQLVRKGDVFEGVVVAPKGDVTIAVRASSASSAYSSVCHYRVE